MGTLTVAGEKIESGCQKVIPINVTQDLVSSIDIHAHVICGKEDGPTLLLLSMLHGEEWLSVLIFKELVKRVDANKLKGNIIAVPVCNPTSMLTGSRCVLDNSDEPDANRAFAGKFQWITNQITNAISDNLFTVSDYLIDYHIGGWGATMADAMYCEGGGADNSISTQSKHMAMAYGNPVLHVLDVEDAPRTSIGHACLRYKIPGIVAEIGGIGFGFKQESDWLEKNLAGIDNVMRYLKMSEGPVLFNEKYLVTYDYWRVSPANGGYLETAVGLDRQFTEVKKGEVLARIIDPIKFELIEELKSPGKGLIFYMCRSAMIRPGGWGFGIVNLENDRNKWIDPPINL